MAGSQQDRAAGTSRRAALGVLGAVPLAASMAPATPAGPPAGPPAGLDGSRDGVPGDLRPGGRFDRFVARQAGTGEFSGAVLLAHRGRAVLTRAHGMANRERQVPNRAGTLFNLASLSKSCTALAIAQLVQRGEVTLHRTIGAYLDGFPARVAGHVTVHHLLTHTSGMPDYVSTEEFADGQRTWGSAEEVMAGLLGIVRTFDFALTGTFDYTNSGYVALGGIVERVSGVPFHEYVRRHIFVPAGMRDTAFITRPQALADDRVARLYWRQPSGHSVDLITTAHHGFMGGPAEGVWSTVGDMLAYATALRSGGLVDPVYAAMFTGGKVPYRPRRPLPAVRQILYGYGFVDLVCGGRRVVGHSGSGPGRSANLDLYPDLDWVAVVLSNHDTSVDPVVGLERRLITRR